VSVEAGSWLAQTPLAATHVSKAINPVFLFSIKFYLLFRVNVFGSLFDNQSRYPIDSPAQQPPDSRHAIPV
jgi:hypothetical protein